MIYSGFTVSILYYTLRLQERESFIKKNKIANFHTSEKTYTKEIIDFVLEMLKSEQKTKEQIIKEYGIPKTTLYKWISKYNLLEGQNV